MWPPKKGKTVADKITHQKIADNIVAGLKKSLREKLHITPKSSYSAIEDGDGWLVRLTPKIAEFNKRRITPDGLEEKGLIDTGKDGFHRKHHLAVVPPDASAIAAAKEAGDEIEPPEGAGLEEMIAAVELAAKPAKKEPAKKAAAKGGEAK